MVVPVCVVLCVSWSCGCRSHWNGCMNVACRMLWGGSRSTKPCVFPCKVAAAGDERYCISCVRRVRLGSFGSFYVFPRWLEVLEWPVLLGCWGRRVGEPCQLADPSGPPKTRWNGYFLWWYPKSQLVSLLNPTILGYDQIHPQNPGFMTTAGWFGCPQARAWQPVTADNAPAARHSHSAVLDTQRMWVFGGHVGQGPRSQHSWFSWWLHPLLVVIVEVFSPTSTICTTLMLRRGSWEGKSVSVCELRYLSL